MAVLEDEAKRAAPGFQGMPLNKAGDLCLKAGDRDQALGYYGRAINTLLEDGQREAARGVANKIIRVHPEAVRTLCTLTWLDLASHHMATAMLHLRDYVEAAKRGGQEDLASSVILDMARIVPDGEFIDASADALDRLGAVNEAAMVREWVRPGGSTDAVSDPEELASRCVDAAMGSNQGFAKD